VVPAFLIPVTNNSTQKSNIIEVKYKNERVGFSMCVEGKDEETKNENGKQDWAEQLLKSQIPSVDGRGITDRVISQEAIDIIQNMQITWSYLFDTIRIRTKLLGNYRVVLESNEVPMTVVVATLNENSEFIIRRLDMDDDEKYGVWFISDKFKMGLNLKSQNIDEKYKSSTCTVECTINNTRYIDDMNKYKEIFLITHSS